MSVVPLAPEEIWITANYKETQLKGVKSGQKVKIEVDMNPGRVFMGESTASWPGRVLHFPSSRRRTLRETMPK